MQKVHPEPAKERVAEDAAGIAADLVKEDPDSTWEAIARRNPTAIPHWTTERTAHAPATKRR